MVTARRKSGGIFYPVLILGLSPFFFTFEAVRAVRDDPGETQIDGIDS
jgi:hypothetical protein